MKTAIVIAPKAALYETAQANSISDELLSGWAVEVRQSWKDYLEITTQYGYSGWVSAAAVRPLPAEEYGLWNTGARDRSSLSPPGLNQENSRPCTPAMIRLGMVDVLESPRVQAKVMSTLFMGSHVAPLGNPIDGWQKILLADNRRGYVPALALLTPPHSFPTQGSLRSAILGYARSFLGTPYRWGGKTREGIDCSGLTFMSYYMCGIHIYRDAAIMEGYPVHAIPLSRIKPADLLYFPSHIALYLGDGTYIHSTGNIHSFCCTTNSLDPENPDYRADLANSLYGAGSIFPFP